MGKYAAFLFQHENIDIHSIIAVLETSVMPATSCPLRINASCATVLGAVAVEERPPALITDERITDRTVSPSRMASLNFLMYTAETASPRPYPSASAEKVLQDPVGD